MDFPILLRLLPFLIVIIILVGATKPKDYCNIIGCGETHIACHNNGTFGQMCPPNRRLVNINAFKWLIVDLHNIKRDEIAGGTDKLPRAARMGEMVWDRELAKMAQLQVKTCDLKSDKCRSLTRFRYSGQNSAIYTYSIHTEDSFTNEWVIRRLVNNWLAESQHTNMSVIMMYPRVAPDPTVGHFTVAVAESNNAIGCAAIQFRRRGINHFMLCCNYATTNLIGRSVYRSAKIAASECKTGPSPNYNNLCSAKEMYDNVHPYTTT